MLLFETRSDEMTQKLLLMFWLKRICSPAATERVIVVVVRCSLFVVRCFVLLLLLFGRCFVFVAVAVAVGVVVAPCSLLLLFVVVVSVIAHVVVVLLFLCFV